MRLIDADDLHKRYGSLFEGSVSDSEMDRATYVIASSPTIDPETLPIVQELMAKLEEARRDCAVAEKNHAECAEKLEQYKQAEAEGQLADAGWIFVKDQLPEDGDTVITVRKHWGLSLEEHYKAPFGWSFGNLIDNEVTHWMPLPKLPEEGE